MAWDGQLPRPLGADPNVQRRYITQYLDSHGNYIALTFGRHPWDLLIPPEELPDDTDVPDLVDGPLNVQLAENR